MKATHISRASAVILFIAGLVLLFASDAILPQMIPGFPAGAQWFGQLLGAAWLGLAALNWLSRATLLGGIFGRPIVFANLTAWLIGALALLGAARQGHLPAVGWGALIVAIVFALAYGWLLLRGPLARDQQNPP